VPWFFKAVPQVISAFLTGLIIMPRTSDQIFYGKFKFGAILAVCFAKIKGGKSVGDFGESDFSRSLRFYPKILVSWALQNLDAIICLNESIYQQVVQIRKSNVDVVRLPNGVDVDVFRPATEEPYLPEYDCLFVGHFIPRKGIAEASDAVSSIGKSAAFIGAGDLTPTGSHVVHAKSVPHFDLPSFYQGAQVFVFPSYNEGSPNALIEAISCGLPVVGWDLPFMREHTDPSFAILVVPGDTHSLAAAIKQVLQDQELRRTMRIAARRFALQNFSLEHRNEKIMKVLTQVVS
jgi:glycosyltransferase involved in cell wall biosynthesis